MISPQRHREHGEEEVIGDWQAHRGSYWSTNPDTNLHQTSVLPKGAPVFHPSLVTSHQSRLLLRALRVSVVKSSLFRARQREMRLN
jgi:hypothetical protein